MPTLPLQTPDFWRVNSYGYPNRFSTEIKAQEAWETFASFFAAHETSYNELKNHWSSRAAPRRLDAHAVESWKATFEEFGLLYVISRSDEITVTPAGFQFHEAAQSNDEESFVWIGLNLLLRYPLQGVPGRRGRNAFHTQSDVLPYRFLYSALRDLGDYLWWTELERIICRVFATCEAKAAVDAVNDIRATPAHVAAWPLVATRRGAFYNSLNQVANHAGMNHLVLTQDESGEHYPSPESRRRHSIARRFISLVNAALGDISALAGCRTSALYVDRLPAAPRHAGEHEYFNYLGAEVSPLASITRAAAPRTLTIAGDTVFILKTGDHYRELAASSAEKAIQGRASELCFLARNHRVILSTDLAWTYIVIGKDLAGADSVKLTLRRGRPITNTDPIQQLLGEDDA
jgi:hypothetical protein